MGLMDIITAAPDTDRIELEEIEEKKNPLEDHEAEEDVAKSDKKDDPKEEDEDDDSEEVKGYRGRKIKVSEREAQEARDRADRLEKQLNDTLAKLAEGAYKQREEPKQENKSDEPDPNTDPDGWVKWKLDQPGQAINEIKKTLDDLRRQQTRNNAMDYLNKQEAAYAKNDPEYYDALENAFQRELAKAKIINPNVTEAQVRAEHEEEKLQLAAHFSKNGMDPIANIKKLVVESYGYTPKKEVKENKADNFDAVARNKQKSASSLSAGGRNGSESGTGKDAARKMSLADFAKLSSAEKDRLYSTGR